VAVAGEFKEWVGQKDEEIQNAILQEIWTSRNSEKLRGEKKVEKVERGGKVEKVKAKFNKSPRK